MSAQFIDLLCIASIFLLLLVLRIQWYNQDNNYYDFSVCLTMYKTLKGEIRHERVNIKL